MQVNRYDSGTVGTVTRTPSGGIRVNGLIGRTGVQVYFNADGSERREYRPPSEVFSPESLASLAGAAVTRLHPPDGAVTASNWHELAIGNVSDTPPARTRVDSEEFIEAPLLINRGSVIKEIDGKEISEISAGYSAVVLATPGISPEGQHYDAVQTNIRYNHVAVGPKGWARAGRAARLRIDGIQEAPSFKDQMSEPTQIVKTILDGIEYVVGSQSHVSALTAKISAEKSRADGAEANLSAAKTSADKVVAEVTAKLDAANDRIKSLEADRSPAGVASLVQAELRFRADAAKLLGVDYKFDGKSRREVMIEAIKKVAPTREIKADASDAFVEAYFASRVDAAPAVVDYNKEQKADELPKVESDADYYKRLDSFEPVGGKK